MEFERIDALDPQIVRQPVAHDVDVHRADVGRHTLARLGRRKMHVRLGPRLGHGCAGRSVQTADLAHENKLPLRPALRERGYQPKIQFPAERARVANPWSWNRHKLGGIWPSTVSAAVANAS